MMKIPNFLLFGIPLKPPEDIVKLSTTDEYMDTIEKCRSLVLEYFEGDEDKTDLWFETRNYGLGNITPNFMMVFGREEKLLQFIKFRLSGEIV